MQKKHRVVISTLVLFLATFLFFFIGISFGLLDNDVKVQPNTTLTYYLDIIYDGKDKELIMSSDTSRADVRSDYIYVTDKIPDGLEFVEFVGTSSGTIGAVSRDDSATTCSGYVVDGYDGLQYDDNTRTVSFLVHNLQAGCKITVGIVVHVPFLSENVYRLDFYNTAYGTENNQSVNSNTVHFYIGADDPRLYSVTYQYTGDLPENAPALPEVSNYISGAQVGVITDITLSGYTFSGWNSTDVTIENGSFIMPSHDVVITGNFTKNPTYEVQYQILGEVPLNYIKPSSVEYAIDDIVTVDSLSLGDVISGYRFLGWETDDVEISNGYFNMPNHQVVLTGRFEKISYTVTYAFQGDVLPDNAVSLLPPSQQYYPGDIVSLPADLISPGYKFLGWNTDDNFKMPEHDLTIYGQWIVETGTFQIDISKKILNPKDYYVVGDVVQFEITVTNPNNYDLTEVRISGNNEVFTEGSNYVLLNSKNIRIDRMGAQQSITILAYYTVQDTNGVSEIIDTTQVTGAFADTAGDYHLDTTVDMKETIDVVVANISLQVMPKSLDSNLLGATEFSLYEDENCTQLVSRGLTFPRLLPNRTYYLKETKSQSGYVLFKDVLEVRVASDGTIEIPNYSVTNTDGRASFDIYLQKINILPNTGGIGIIPFVIGGFSLIALSCGGYLFYLKKRRSKRK